ncbi:hypothetical protein MCESLAEM7_00207 [Candidatus Pelagibacterales bacterium]
MNILMVIYADPRFYISIVSMSNYFSSKNFDVDIVCLNSDHKGRLDVVDFGKNAKLAFFKNFSFLYKLNLFIFLFFY